MTEVGTITLERLLRAHVDACAQRMYRDITQRVTGGDVADVLKGTATLLHDARLAAEEWHEARSWLDSYLDDPEDSVSDCLRFVERLAPTVAGDAGVTRCDLREWIAAQRVAIGRAA